MTRTARIAATRFGISLFALVVLVTGCTPNEKDLKIEDLTAENDQLKRELDDRDRQLAEAQARENEARSTIDELNRELARTRADLAMKGNNQRPVQQAQPIQQPVAQADGWISTPSFDMISIPGEVLFASGKADLTSGGQNTMAKLARDIQSRYSDRDIFVIGHTDNDPIRKSKWKDNWELGSARALTCVRQLQRQGVNGSRLIQANCGEFRPTDANSRANKAKNRRVEFYAVPRGGVLANSTARR
ncbi:MAG: OmpA family protein [Phycisphaerales bacterium]|nr:OmpA family protein [Phycisphaerales bacterium]MCB9858638.1 OmpA family protein [Phycisphaerales bacterium]